MARKITEVQRQMFEGLALAAELPVERAAQRYIFLDDEGKKWVAKGVLKGELKFDSVNRIIHANLGGKNVVVLVNFEPPVELPPGIVGIDINAGLFVLLAAEAGTQQRRTDPLEILQYVFYDLGPDYQGHDVIDIAQFYSRVFALEIGDEQDFQSADILTRVAALMAASCPDLHTLPFSKSTLSKCVEMALDVRSQVPLSLVSHALVAVKWEHCFLDLYRCVERLFAIPTMLELKRTLGVKLPGVTISSIVEETTGWRKSEEDGLGALFYECNAICHAFHGNYQGIDASLSREYSSRSVARYLYKLRNSIVHYRPATEMPSLTEAAWEKIIDFLVELIGCLYDNYRQELIGGAVVS